jgi:hypothetical protein
MPSPAERAAAYRDYTARQIAAFEAEVRGGDRVPLAHDSDQQLEADLALTRNPAWLAALPPRNGRPELPDEHWDQLTGNTRADGTPETIADLYVDRNLKFRDEGVPSQAEMLARSNEAQEVILETAHLPPAERQAARLSEVLSSEFRRDHADTDATLYVQAAEAVARAAPQYGVTLDFNTPTGRAAFNSYVNSAIAATEGSGEHAPRGDVDNGYAPATADQTADQPRAGRNATRSADPDHGDDGRTVGVGGSGLPPSSAPSKPDGRPATDHMGRPLLDNGEMLDDLRQQQRTLGIY